MYFTNILQIRDRDRQLEDRARRGCTATAAATLATPLELVMAVLLFLLILLLVHGTQNSAFSAIL